MPEAFAVLAVFIIAIVAWFAAWMHARDPANNNVYEEVARLRAHTDWLKERLVRAQREGWGGDMMAAISGELDSNAHQLARAAHGGREIKIVQPRGRVPE